MQTQSPPQQPLLLAQVVAVALRERLDLRVAILQSPWRASRFLRQCVPAVAAAAGAGLVLLLQQAVAAGERRQPQTRPAVPRLARPQAAVGFLASVAKTALPEHHPLGLFPLVAAAAEVAALPLGWLVLAGSCCLVLYMEAQPLAPQVAASMLAFRKLAAALTQITT